MSGVTTVLPPPVEHFLREPTVLDGLVFVHLDLFMPLSEQIFDGTDIPLRN